MDEILAPAGDFVKSMLEFADSTCKPEIKKSLAEMGRDGWVVTSSYAGTLSCSTSNAWICEEVKKHFHDQQGKVICYSATEIDVHAQRVLQNHGADTGPLHIFDNILKRVPQAV